MSVRKLDLPSILRRIATARQSAADPSLNLGVARQIEIPDPMTLVDLADKAGLSLDWLLYGGSEQGTGNAAPTCSKIDHPPPVNLVLQQPTMVELRRLLSGRMLTRAVRNVMASWIPAGTIEEAAEAIANLAADQAMGQILIRRDYINATGIIVHTGWGNAPLAASARERLLESAGATPTGAADTQSRTEACDGMICALTNAERSAVTTSNAASLLLVAGALASGREIVVAARDLIEISEGARIGDILEAAGARVMPVGAANCVNIEDFRQAMSSDTAMVLRSHASNVATTGYVEHVPDAELAKLAHNHGSIHVVNLGGGSFIDFAERGLPQCPTLSRALGDGADLVLASGDKIIGGPQSGIVVGKNDLIDHLVRHPLARTCRPGKLTLAALEGTLASYVSGRAWEDIPTLQLLGMDVTTIRERACLLAEELRKRGYDAVDAEDRAQCGAAVVPSVGLPTWTVRLKHPKLSDEELCALLLARRVITRKGHGAVIVDLRSLPCEDDPRLYRALGVVPNGLGVTDK
jgi:L-seryl-tRNA(Ser) seleniumtransferase